MILKDNASAFSRRLWQGRIFLFLAPLFLLLLYVFFSRSTERSAPTEGYLLCDAEQTVNDQFITGNQTCVGGIQSEEAAFTGRFSCKLEASGSAYGMTGSYPVAVGERVRVSVWRKLAKKTGCVGVLAILEKPQTETSFYQQVNYAVESRADGWERLEVTTYILRPLVNNELHFFVWAPEGTAYFDDLRIEREPLPAERWEPLQTQLIIKQDQWTKLEQKREEALRTGLLLKDESDWVKAKIQNLAPVADKEPTLVELRLKGDWLDHLEGDRWSFRVQVQGFDNWNRLQEFSLQSPHTRAHLKEWFLHQWFLKEDVLSPRYDFLQLRLNNREEQVYAYEEHFLKQLPEFHLRREGPIVKFAEDGMWAARNQAMQQGYIPPAEYERWLEATEVLPFDEKRVQEDPKLREQFRIAQNLMWAYKMGTKPAKEVFHLPLLARYFAIVSISDGMHGAIWHNQRFYYNPVLTKLEPIGYDGYDETGKSNFSAPFLGHYTYNPEKSDRHLVNFLMNDADFMRIYIQELQRLSQLDYLDSLFNQLDLDLRLRESLIQHDFRGYQFPKNDYYERARSIAYTIQPLNNVSLRVHTEQAAGEGKALRLSLTNLHCLPLEIVGFGNQKQPSISHPTEGQILPCSSPYAIPTSTLVEAPEGTNRVFYRVLGLETVYHSEVSFWNQPTDFSPVQDLFANKTISSNAVYEVMGKTVLFRGKKQTAADVLIPEGYEVVFEAGSELDLVRQAKFISYSPIESRGDADAPVRIHSSDSSAAGFTVLQTGKRNRLSHTRFEHFNTLKYKGWELTGAVTFYESPVDLLHCTFTRNHCEDALNLVRSEFFVSHCVVSHTFADGLDVDFCKGRIQDTYFYKTGNDGVDFSTSQITAERIHSHQVGDKGISVGEEAQVHIISAKVDGAVIGIAAKDFSTATIDFIELKNCETGFAAYQKKPEYGGATLNVARYTLEKVNFLHKIEGSSTLNLPERQ